MDGIAIMTSLGRKSPIFGNATGGSGWVTSFAVRLEQITDVVQSYFDTPERIQHCGHYRIVRQLGGRLWRYSHALKEHHGVGDWGHDACEEWPAVLRILQHPRRAY